MGKIFTLSDDIRAIAQDAIDDLIDQLGKDCKLVYPSNAERCPNCVYDLEAHRSTNVYKPGGPIPFDSGACPVCDGIGTITTPASESIRFLCQWNPRDWFIAPGNIRIPEGYMQIKGYLKDMQKVLRAEYIVIQTPIANVREYRYKLDSEPIDQGNIIQGRYFIALLKRYTG